MSDMSHGARDLSLFAENDQKLVKSLDNDYNKNLTIKKAQGKYDPVQAVKLMMYFADRTAQAYFADTMRGLKDHGGATWHGMFPKADREQFAKSLVKEFENRHKQGEFDEYIPKKYRAKPEGKLSPPKKSRSK
jgi:cyclopropane fatty-acyl-phospholipid synthase-like methyltransferase